MSSLQAIVETIAFVLKWALVLVMAANFRAIPGIWHLRVFWPTIEYLIIRFPIMFSFEKSMRFHESRSPIGKSPFAFTQTFSTRCTPDDADYNAHLSNSAYAKAFDIARMRAVTAWFPTILLRGGRLGLGFSHFQFLKEIPLGRRYEIHTSIVAYEEKWMTVVAQFISYPKHPKSSDKTYHPSLPMSRSSTADPSSSNSETYRSARAPRDVRLGEEPWIPQLRMALSKLSTPSPSSSSSGSTPDTPVSLNDSDTESDDSESTSASSVFSLSKTNTFPPNVTYEPKQVAKLPLVPEGALVHCVHISSYCFKYDGITFPPRVALVTCGFGDPAKGRWERIKAMTDTRFRTVNAHSTHTFGELYKGEWRRYVGEGLWELPEYEVENVFGIEKFGALRTAMDSLRF